MQKIVQSKVGALRAGCYAAMPNRFPMNFDGRILIIDLTRSTAAIELLPDHVAATYLGGKGLGSYLLYTHNPPGVDPLSADNRLILATGPVSGPPRPDRCVNRFRGSGPDRRPSDRYQQPAGPWRHPGPGHPVRRGRMGPGRYCRARQGAQAGRLWPARAQRHGAGLCHLGPRCL